MKYSRLLVLIAPVLILVFSELVIFFPRSFFSVLLFANLTVLAAILVFLKANKTKKTLGTYLGTAILPLGFLSSIFVYSSLAVNRFFVQFLFRIVKSTSTNLFSSLSFLSRENNCLAST